MKLLRRRAVLTPAQLAQVETKLKLWLGLDWSAPLFAAGKPVVEIIQMFVMNPGVLRALSSSPLPAFSTVGAFHLPSGVPHSRHASHAMTKVAILPETSAQGEVEYRAIASGHQALAKTAGAALDALTAQLPGDEAGTLVIVQNHGPDRFFTAGQQQRLGELMARWRTVRDTGGALRAVEEAELEALVEAEARASGERASAMLAGLAK